MNRTSLLIREFWLFLKEQKKFWLLPIVIVLLLFGALLVFAQSSALAPFIYSMF
jgi:drug/metabolite transporter superfamily protein YnfA